MEKEIAVLLVLSGIKTTAQQDKIVKLLLSHNPSLDAQKIQTELLNAHAYEQ